jgi:hypothetical protein
MPSLIEVGKVNSRNAEIDWMLLFRNCFQFSYVQAIIQTVVTYNILWSIW